MGLLNKLIDKLELNIQDPKVGLPDEIFYMVSRLTPLVNVDLIIYSSENEILFTWRDDQYAGKGWHLPGGIIRYKEDMLSRVHFVAKNEVGVSLEKVIGPIDIKQIIAENRKNRAHFISLLFKCNINRKNEDIILNKIKNNPKKFLFSRGTPKKLLSWHRIYENYF